MKKIMLLLAATLMCGAASAQFAGIMRGQQQEPLPEGYKPSSTNIFLAQYPAVNTKTHQVMFRVVAPSAQKVQIDICNKKYGRMDRNFRSSSRWIPLLCSSH